MFPTFLGDSNPQKLPPRGLQTLWEWKNRVVLEEYYPVVIINWVQYLGPPGPFSFPDSRDLLEVLRDFLGREREGGSLGDPPGP